MVVKLPDRLSISFVLACAFYKVVKDHHCRAALSKSSVTSASLHKFQSLQSLQPLVSVLRTQFFSSHDISAVCSGRHATHFTYIQIYSGGKVAVAKLLIHFADILALPQSCSCMACINFEHVQKSI